MTYLNEVVVIDPKWEPVEEKLRICLNPGNDVSINGVKPCDLLQFHTS